MNQHAHAHASRRWWEHRSTQEPHTMPTDALLPAMCHASEQGYSHVRGRCLCWKVVCRQLTTVINNSSCC